MQVSSSTSVVYVTDLGFDRFDPSDLFDWAFILRSPDHALTGVCLANPNCGGRRVLDALTLEAGTDLPPLCDSAGLASMLAEASEPVNLVVVACYSAVAATLAAHPDLFREKVARLFIVGGLANDYGSSESPRRMPIDPRLRESLPARFAPEGDPRIVTREEKSAWATLLASGQGVIWLPRDICLWRYAAPGILGRGADPLAAFLLRETFWNHLQVQPDRYRAAEQPVELSALPALLLARHPDPTIWLRLFRAVTARVEIDTENASLVGIDLASDHPNLYLVSAIDSQALGKMMTNVLRGDSVSKQGVQ